MSAIYFNSGSTELKPLGSRKNVCAPSRWGSALNFKSVADAAVCKARPHRSVLPHRRNPQLIIIVRNAFAAGARHQFGQDPDAHADFQEMDRAIRHDDV